MPLPAQAGWIHAAQNLPERVRRFHLALYTWAHPRHERLFQLVAERRLDAVQRERVQLEAEV